MGIAISHFHALLAPSLMDTKLWCLVGCSLVQCLQCRQGSTPVTTSCSTRSAISHKF